MNVTKSVMKRELILEAVSLIVREDGIEKLTLEAVSKRAGISKGGLLYHFPNKDSLILGMIEHLTEHFLNALYEEAGKDPVVKGRWSRAYIRASRNHYLNDLYTAISAAHFTNPALLTKLQELYNTVQEKIEDDGLNPANAALVRLAIDGLWFAEMFHLATPGTELTQQVVENLLALTKE